MIALKTFSIAGNIFLIALICLLSSAQKTRILDDDGLGIENIAHTVCHINKGVDKQFIRYSTVYSLTSFFQTIEYNHELAKCAKTYLPAFELMKKILSVGNEDVCGSDKLDLIEEFHRNFVSKVRKYRQEQKVHHLAAPKLLKLFFMNYVSALSSICAQAAKQDLEMISYERDQIEHESAAIMNPFFDLFGKLKSSKDMFLVWNFIDSLPIERDTELSRYLHPNPANRLYIQVHRSDAIAKIQDACKVDLKPFYSLSLLPVIRLADMGFYPKNEELVQMLNSKQEYSDFYAVVQLCEIFLPIRVVENTTLDPNQIVILSREESAKLNLTEENGLYRKNGLNPANRLDDLKSILNDELQTHIKKVKDDVDFRERAQSDILRRLIKRFKNESSHKSNRFTLSDIQSKEDLESILLKAIPKVDELHPMSIIEDAHDTNDTTDSLVREKRGVVKFVRKTMALVIAGLLTIGYVTLWIVLVIIKAIVLTPIVFILLLSEILRKLTGIHKHFLPRSLYKGLQYELPAFHYKAYDKIAG